MSKEQTTVEGTYIAYNQCMQNAGRIRKTMSSITIQQDDGQKIRVDIWHDKVPHSIQKGDRLRAIGTFRRSHFYGDHLKGKTLEVVERATKQP